MVQGYLFNKLLFPGVRAFTVSSCGKILADKLMDIEQEKNCQPVFNRFQHACLFTVIKCLSLGFFSTYHPYLTEAMHKD